MSRAGKGILAKKALTQLLLLQTSAAARLHFTQSNTAADVPATNVCMPTLARHPL